MRKIQFLNCLKLVTQSKLYRCVQHLTLFFYYLALSDMRFFKIHCFLHFHCSSNMVILGFKTCVSSPLPSAFYTVKTGHTFLTLAYFKMADIKWGLQFHPQHQPSKLITTLPQKYSGSNVNVWTIWLQISSMQFGNFTLFFKGLYHCLYKAAK